MAHLDYSAQAKIYICVEDDGTITMTRIEPNQGDQGQYNDIELVLERVQETLERASNG